MVTHLTKVFTMLRAQHKVSTFPVFYDVTLLDKKTLQLQYEQISAYPLGKNGRIPPPDTQPYLQKK
jgi:hypothetical protein